MGYRGEPDWMMAPGNSAIGFIKNREVWANNGFMRMQANGEYKAWWQSDGYKGAFEGGVPLDYIRTTMLGWLPQEADVAVKLYVTEGDFHDQDDKGYFKWIPATDHKAIVRSDNETIFAFVGRDSYEVHDYTQFLDHTAKLVDGEVGVASTFLMDKGGVFVVNLELPEDVTTTSGITHRVRLMGMTSMNTKYATQWKIVDEFAVCSNSFRLNLAGNGNEYRVKHTSQSLGRINDASTALGLIYKATEEYTKFLDAMTEVHVTWDQVSHIINNIFPMPDAKVDGGKIKNQGAMTIADNKRQRLLTMAKTDPRAKPWDGSLFGVFQAWSTWNQWERPKGGLESSIMGTVTGKFDQGDAQFFDIVRSMDDIDMRPLVAAVS